MSKPRQSDKRLCFYCNAIVGPGSEEDHFPLPFSVGGTEAVPCCQPCHNMKDRYSLDDWPIEWVQAIIADFPKLNRETRLFLARTMRIIAQSRGERTPKPAPMNRAERRARHGRG